MPELFNEMSKRVLVPGDVVMVVRKMKDKQTNKPFDWKFFMVITQESDGFTSVSGWVVGTTSKHLKENPLTLGIDDPKNTIHYLPMEEWPDGVLAFRMQLILQRKIEDL